VRPRFAFVLTAFAVSAILAGEPDAITWVRMDGAPGWSAAVPRELHPDGVAAAPLLAPTWFAKIPNATVQLAPEGSFDLASARGKVLLLDYWASWCAPCLKELPHLQSLHVARNGDGFVALAVNADEDAKAASESAKRLGLTMKIGVNDPALYQTLGVRTLPALFAIDKQGRLRARWDGYRVGLENEIAATVDKLRADDTSGTTREVATVLAGEGRLVGRWYRDLPVTAEGVVGLPTGLASGARVVAAGGDELVSFDAEGEVVARLKVTSAAGRLLDFGAAADGTRELVSYHPGGTALSVIALRSGAERTIALPAPLLDVTVAGEAAGDARLLAMATMSGAASAAANDAHAKLLPQAAGVRSVTVSPGRTVLALSEDGTIGPFPSSTPAWAQPAAGAERLLVARENGVITATRAVTAAVSGAFLPEGGRQLAVATYGGHLALFDEASGRVLFDAIWAGVHDLAVADLDGDGRDELLVASGHSLTVLGAAGR